MNARPPQKHTPNKPLLYWLVFDAVVVKWMVMLLFAFFFMHPALPVFAAGDGEGVSPAEDTDLSDSSSEDMVVEPTEESPQPSDSEIAPVVIAAPTDPEVTEPVALILDDTPVTDEESPDTVLSIATSSSEEVIGRTDQENVSSPADVETPTTTPEVAEDDTTVPVPEVPLNPEESTPEPLPTVETPQDDEEDTATSTQAQIVYIDRSDSDPNILTFETKNCVAAGEGAFYCSETTTEAVTQAEDTVFVAQDGDGDTEIFARMDNKTTQLTHNTDDDNQPDYDPKSHSVVWQRLVNSEYQIIHFDIDEETETILTTGGNNMEPSHEDGITVWQRWVNNNWEIILNDGQTERQLTDNNTHDIAPDVRNGFVMWNAAAAGNERAISVYELSTGLTSTISDTEGGQVTNPRFVLVYDTKLANGDVVTKGFNPETGEVEPLSAAPADTPQEIPPADPTGETRALIQNKTTSGRDGFETQIDGNSTSTNNGTSTASGPISEVGVGTASSTNASQFGTSTVPVLDLSGTSTNVLPLTDFDLIVEPFSSTTSSQSINSTSSSNLVE